MITLEKPASLPPIEIVTRLVEAFSGPSWLLSTSWVFAPEQATKLSVWPIRGATLAGYACGLRWQPPLSA